MSGIDGIGIGSIASLPISKKSTQTAALSSSTPFGDLLSKQGLVIGSGSATAASKLTPADAGQPSSAATEFQKYMEMSPAEKIRYNMLKDLGLSEDDLKALPPEQRERIETAIANRIKEQLQQTVNASDATSGAASDGTLNNGSNQNNSGPAGLFQAIQANNSDNRLLDIYS